MTRIEPRWNDDKALAANILVGVIRGKERPRAQRTAFHRRDARQQSKLFARWNQSLTHSPNSNRLCFETSAMISQYRFTRDKFCRFCPSPGNDKVI